MVSHTEKPTHHADQPDPMERLTRDHHGDPLRRSSNAASAVSAMRRALPEVRRHRRQRQQASRVPTAADHWPRRVGNDIGRARRSDHLVVAASPVSRRPVRRWTLPRGQHVVPAILGRALTRAIPGSRIPAAGH